jgi:hypothetical protein
MAMGGACEGGDRRKQSRRTPKSREADSERRRRDGDVHARAQVPQYEGALDFLGCFQGTCRQNEYLRVSNLPPCELQRRGRWEVAIEDTVPAVRDSAAAGKLAHSGHSRAVLIPRNPATTG